MLVLFPEVHRLKEVEVVQVHCRVRPNQIAEQPHVIFAITTNLILTKS